MTGPIEKFLPVFLSLAILSIQPSLAGTEDASGGADNGLELKSVVVAGREVPIQQNHEVNLKAFPRQIEFHFGMTTNAGRLPVRLRYKLEGYENDWHSGGGAMFLSVRFYNNSGDQISHEIFNVSGESAGWTGSLKTSALAHRRETVVAPPATSHMMVVLSSAGSPATEGIYVVANLSVSKLSQTAAAPEIIESPLAGLPSDDNSNRPPAGWMRDGLETGMAKIVGIGHDPTIKAFAILDDSPINHAEWRNDLLAAPTVAPSEKLLVEWNEMYSIGVEDSRSASYPNLDPGTYTFKVEEVDIYGRPTGSEAVLKVKVSQPLWKNTWFWGAVLVGAISLILGYARYAVRQKMKREMLRLKNQQALERERLRIAHDIHDDLGARVTQISLLSALAHDNEAFPAAARADFDQITNMSRDLVVALYETVWAVNPENDNLNSLGNYLCQMVNQLCEHSQIRCRFHLSDMPRDVQAPSQMRHNITMVVKEAVHNVIKHASASEVTVSADFTGKMLTISIHDDGKGFENKNQTDGHGLKNMKQRMADIGGACSIESRPGAGTTVQLKLLFK